MTKRVLLIDDLRDRNADVTARNYNDGIKQLKENGPWDLLLLDHDIASYDNQHQEKTGYHVMCWLEENQKYLPADVRCISASPVGKERINQVICKLYDKQMWELR